MALVDCKDCDKKFSTDAKRCPNCGAKKPSNIIKICLISFSSLVFLSFLVNRLPEPVLSPKELEEANMISAKYICQQYVKEALHDPDSAEFEGYPNNYFVELKKGVYHVQVNFKAKNGFNALRSSMANCRVVIAEKSSQGKATKWSLIKLDSWNL